MTRTLFFSHASCLSVSTLELALGGAELNVELVVVLLRLEDLALELLHLARCLGEIAVHARFGLVVRTLLLEVLHLNLLKVLAHRPERLDLRRELVLLLLELGVDLLHDRGDLVQGLALRLVDLGLLDGGLLEHRLRLAQAHGRGVLRLQELLRPDQDGHLVPELAQLGLQLLESGRLVAQRRGVVFELVALHELVPLHLLVFALLRGQLPAKIVPLLLQRLLLLEHDLLLLRHEVRLLLVDREPRVLVLLGDLQLEGLDLGLHLADLSLQVVYVLLRDRRIAQG
mmetsp:Transcript_25027/g.70527  ORF Transcript_25027/g.70527 Transcript_25027/m.70527 type:complete len:285 (+) Transcript_25027:508-1362(+)